MCLYRDVTYFFPFCSKCYLSLFNVFILSSLIIISSVLTVWICAISSPWKMRDPSWGKYSTRCHVIAYRIITYYTTCLFPYYFYFLYCVSFIHSISSPHHLIRPSLYFTVTAAAWCVSCVFLTVKSPRLAMMWQQNTSHSQDSHDTWNQGNKYLSFHRFWYFLEFDATSSFFLRYFNYFCPVLTYFHDKSEILVKLAN